MRNLYSTLFFSLISVLSMAQTRYCQEIFNSVTITDNIVYSTNKIYWPFTQGIPPKGDLDLCLYEPSGDTAAQRPLLIVLAGGNFLPQPYNQSVMGSRNDSAIVELCKRFARRGYVVAALSYRQGWNAISSDQDVRTSSLLKAVYRAVQDTKGAVRFFKHDAANANLYRVDGNKIALWGDASAGFVSMTYASLNKFSEVTLPKFLDGTTALPYLDTNIMGNVDGFGGDTAYTMENWPGYSSDISMVISVGGAVGDSTWIEPGEVPTICFHVVGDPYAAYTEGMVIVPTTGGNVVYVSGSYQIARRCNNPLYGNNNAIFQSPPFIDAYTLAANQVNDGYEGLFPSYTTPAMQSGPWSWWDPTNAAALWGQDVETSEYATNPNMSATQGRAYLDSMVGYAAPRMNRVFGFTDCPGTVSTSEYTAQKINIVPNPTQGIVTISAGTRINNVTIHNAIGQLQKSISGNGSSKLSLLLQNLPSGIYSLQLQTEHGLAVQKLILE